MVVFEMVELYYGLQWILRRDFPNLNWYLYHFG